MTDKQPGKLPDWRTNIRTERQKPNLTNLSDGAKPPVAYALATSAFGERTGSMGRLPCGARPPSLQFLAGHLYVIAAHRILNRFSERSGALQPILA